MEEGRTGAELDRSVMATHMHGYSSAIEAGIRGMLEDMTTPPAGSLLADRLDDVTSMSTEDTTPAHRLKRLCALAAERLHCTPSALLLELGLRWWKTRQPDQVDTEKPAIRRSMLLARLRTDKHLFDLGLVVVSDLDRYPRNGVILHHRQPLSGCRSFVFGVLHGVGLSHGIHVDVRLLEPLELNGHADVIAVELD
jgi:hypothetical protein